MPRDSQRSKEYAWEWAIEKEFGYETSARSKLKLTFDECRALLEAVWLDETGGHEFCTHRDKPPHLKRAHGKRNASCFRHFPPTVELTTFGHNTISVLHEAGHAIMSRSEWTTPVKFLPAHGPHFVRLVMRLYEKYLGFDLERMKEMARDRRLKFVSEAELDTFLMRGTVEGVQQDLKVAATKGESS